MKLFPHLLLTLFIVFFISLPTIPTVFSATPITTGLITSMETGDRGCYVYIKDQQGKEHSQIGDFQFCDEKSKYINKNVILKYRTENVLSASCEGNMDCGKSDQVYLITQIQIQK
ncbi:hypothetical protein BVY03_02800 [bacterium K02(2017)]|nr:hypothetical protein BVY03_02800 [bacterium K02(2017)]